MLISLQNDDVLWQGIFSNVLVYTCLERIFDNFLRNLLSMRRLTSREEQPMYAHASQFRFKSFGGSVPFFLMAVLQNQTRVPGTYQDKMSLAFRQCVFR